MTVAVTQVSVGLVAGESPALGRSRLGWWGRLVVLLTALTVLAGCGRKKPKVARGEAPEVIVASPVIKEVTEYEDFLGRTEASEMVDIRARVTGYLLKSFFKEGTDVKKDDLLFEIDPRSYRAELNKADANVKQAEAHLRRLNTDYRRALSLSGTGAISREEADKIAGDRAEAEAGVGAAQAAKELAALNLSYCRIAAPLSGRISKRTVDPGNLVKADDTSLTSIVALNPMKAYFEVDERTLLRLRRLLAEGKIKKASETKVPLLIGLADEEGFSTTGVIDFADNRLDNSTGTLRVRCVINNPDQRRPGDKSASYLLSPGLFVRLRLPIGDPQRALLVPEQALGTDQGKKYLYVVNDNDEVVYRRVEVGVLDKEWRVIKSGLGAGERVIVRGLQRVRDGVKVRPKTEDAKNTSDSRGKRR